MATFEYSPIFRRARTAALLGIVASLWLASASAQEARRFDIAAQSLSQALVQFCEQSQLVVTAATDLLTGKHAPAVHGAMLPEEALRKLLEGSGLKYIKGSDGEVTILQTNLSYGERNGGNGLQLAQAGAKGADASASSATQSPAEQRAATDPGQNSTGMQIEEVVVTATKRAEREQDIPVSIAVIGHQEIERRGVVGMEDYLRSIPGVSQIDRGGRDNAIIIRGINTEPETENFGGGTTVATYFDETPITAAGSLAGGGIDIRPVDIERIEVLRGPQGTAFGDASLGGAMRIIPVRPQLDHFSARLTGNYSQTSGSGGDNSMIQGVVNIPLVTDRFALRAVGYRYEDSGFYRNISGTDPTVIAAASVFNLGDFVRGPLQDDVGRMVTRGGRLAALWKPTDDLNLALNYLTQRIDQDGSPIATVGKYDQTYIPVAPQARLRGEAGQVNDTKMDLLNAVMSYDLGWAALTSVASWIDSGSVSNTSFLFPFPGTTMVGPGDFSSFTGEIRLASQLLGRTQFLTGLYYEELDDDFLQVVHWPGTPATSPVGTNPLFYQSLTRTREQRAIFGEVSYKLTEKLTATAGGRYFEFDKKEGDLREGGFVGVPIGLGQRNTVASSDGNSSFKAGLSFKPREDSLLYASWSQGFRLGRPTSGVPAALCDPNNDGVIDGSNVSVASTREIESDFLDSYEVGGKFSFLDRRVVLSASAYHIDWTNLPVTAFAGTCSFGYTVNVGEATSDGAELQASIVVRKGLKIDVGAGYTQPEISKDQPIQGWRKGDRLPGSPKVSANLAAQYDFNVAAYKAFVRADSLYVGKFHGDVVETPLTQAGGYVKVDARAGIDLGNLSVELFARNLTDNDAFTWRTARPSLVGVTPFYGYRLRPRTVGIQLGYSFQ